MPQVARAARSRSGRRGCGDKGEAALAGHLDRQVGRDVERADRARAARPHAGLRRGRRSTRPRRARHAGRAPASPGPTAGGCAASCLRPCVPRDRQAGQIPRLLRRCSAAVRSRRPMPPCPKLWTPTLRPEPGPPARRSEARTPSPPPKQGWFQRLKAGPDQDLGASCRKTSPASSPSASSTLIRSQELEDLLIQADLGVETAARITDRAGQGPLRQGDRHRGGARGACRRGRARAGPRRQAAA